MPVRHDPSTLPVRERVSASFAIGVTAAVIFSAAPDEASAAGVGGVTTSFALLAALSALLLLKAWQAHMVAGGMATAVGMLALVAGMVLIWRSRGMLGVYSRPAKLPAVVQRDCDAPACPQPIYLPGGVDRQALLSDLRRLFVELQAAWDDNARDRLLEMTTPDMLEELCAARSAGLGAGNRTQVMTLDAHLVAFEELEAAQVVCVEFSGMIRESVHLTDSPFRELWLLTRARTGGGASGWRLARHQAML